MQRNKYILISSLFLLLSCNQAPPGEKEALIHTGAMERISTEVKVDLNSIQMITGSVSLPVK